MLDNIIAAPLSIIENSRAFGLTDKEVLCLLALSAVENTKAGWEIAAKAIGYSSVDRLVAAVDSIAKKGAVSRKGYQLDASSVLAGVSARPVGIFVGINTKPPKNKKDYELYERIRDMASLHDAHVWAQTMHFLRTEYSANVDRAVECVQCIFDLKNRGGIVYGVSPNTLRINYPRWLKGELSPSQGDIDDIMRLLNG